MNDLTYESVVAEFQVVERRPGRCPHGPFGFANPLPGENIKDSLTFSVEPKTGEPAWVDDPTELHGGRSIVCWDIVRDTTGLRARRARLWRLGDDDPETREKRNREIDAQRK